MPGGDVNRGGDGNSLKVEFHLCVSNIAHSDKRSGTPYLTKFGENTSKRHQTVAARNIEVLRRAVPMPLDGIGRARPLTLGNKKIDYGRNLHRLTLLTHLSNSGVTTTRRENHEENSFSDRRYPRIPSTFIRAGPDRSSSAT